MNRNNHKYDQEDNKYPPAGKDETAETRANHRDDIVLHPNDA